MFPSFIIALIVFQLVFFAGHFAVYQMIAMMFGKHLVIQIIFVLLSLTFVTSSALAFRYTNKYVTWYSKLSSYWLALFALLLPATIPFYVLYAVANLGSFDFAARSWGFVIILVTLAFYIYGVIHSGSAETTAITIKIPHLPVKWKGKRIVFVSDLHLGNVRGQEFCQEVVDKIKGLQPDIVCVGGDMFDGVACNPRKLVASFTQLTSPDVVPYGVFFVSGNHEEFRNSEAFFSAIKGVGIKILDNEKVDIHGIDFIGVDYQDTEKKEDFDKILGGLHPADHSSTIIKPSILLKHTPFFIDVTEKHQISLQLSGHTHQGQMFPFQYITKRLFKGFDYGPKRLKGTAVYTSSGVGTWGPPLRIGTKSEVVIIELN